LLWIYLVLVFLGVWDLALCCLRTFYVFNICTHDYKFSSLDCLCYVP
jgi:hypothetical protein